MFEIFSCFPIIQDRLINSVHIGDEHGSTLLALNHFLHSKFDNVEFEWNWKCFSSNPYYECSQLPTNNDHVISNAYDNWTFGIDYTGNVNNKTNIKYFIELCNNSFDSVNLVILISISTTNNPLEKEKSTFDDKFAELTAGLNILCAKGNLIFEVDSFFRTSYISLMYLLNCIFENVHLYKPSTSPQSSFSCYLICMNYLKSSCNLDNILKKMVEHINVETWEIAPMFQEVDIPNSFIKAHIEIQHFFNCNTIEGKANLIRYKNDRDSNITKHVTHLINVFPSFFIQKFKIRQISQEKLIIKNKIAYYAFPLDFEIISKFLTNDFFSYVETDNMKDAMDKFDSLDKIIQKFHEFQKKIKWPFADRNVFALKNVQDKKIKIEFGKNYEYINNSLFLRPKYIISFWDLIENIFGKNIILKNNPGSKCIINSHTTINFEMDDNYGQSEKRFYKNIFTEMLKCLPQNIKFDKTIFLSNFSCSVLYILCSIYEVVSIYNNGYIILEKPKIEKWETIKRDSLLYETINGPDFEFTYSFMCPVDLQRCQFCEIVSAYNTQLILEYIIKCLDKLADKYL